MSWLEDHRESELLAVEAENARSAGAYAQSLALYRRAAESETKALWQIESSKARTYGILAVSAAALWFKANAYSEAEKIALTALNSQTLPAFANAELKVILQNVWVESAKLQGGVKFLPGQVVISVQGGEVVAGGAPLDLIVEKVQLVQSMFYRTIEHVKGVPLRTRGAPSKEIVEACQPWLFQEAPGSYQFSVAVQQPRQKDFFKPDMEPSRIASHFMDVLRSAVVDPNGRLRDLVPDKGYRATFLKLSRSLAPTTKTKRFSQITVKASGDTVSTVIDVASRGGLNEAIRREEIVGARQDGVPLDIRGVLRAVHLDKDWIEVVSVDDTYKVWGLKDSVDDLIGPFVNRQVYVRAMRRGQRIVFIDIEAED